MREKFPFRGCKTVQPDPSTQGRNGRYTDEWFGLSQNNTNLQRRLLPNK